MSKQFRFGLSVVLFTIFQVLAACSGSSDSASTALMPSTPTPVTPAPDGRSLQVLGAPFNANMVLTTSCAAGDAPAKETSAMASRYPLSTNVFRGWGSYASSRYFDPVRMRSDGAGGYVVTHQTDVNGAMFKVDSQGNKTVLPLPYPSAFDVSPDGAIWFVHNGVLSVGRADGTVTALANEAGATAYVDGVLGATPLGKIGLIAAGKDKVYLLIEESTPNYNRLGLPLLNRSLRILTRSAQVGWTVQTVSFFASLAGDDVISSMKVGPANELVLLLNQPFNQLVSKTLSPTGITLSVEDYNYEYLGQSAVWVMPILGNWTLLGAKTFPLAVSTVSPHSYKHYSYAFDAADLSIAPNGTIWLGGAGAIYTVDNISGWRLFEGSAQHPRDDVGRDGSTATATFANAGQLVADAKGVTFYDGETCQIRRLESAQLKSISGPVLSPINFTGAALIGTNNQGELLFSYGDEPKVQLQQLNGDVIRYGLGKVNLSDPQFAASKLRSLAGHLGEPYCSYGTSYWAGSPSCSGYSLNNFAADGQWVSQGPTGLISNQSANVYQGQEMGIGSVVSVTSNWPGVLKGFNLSGHQISSHILGRELYVFGVVRTDPAIDIAAGIYAENRLYKVDLMTGIATVVAAKSLPSTSFLGRYIDLTPVFPVLGVGSPYVQRRSDGQYWLSNGNEVWILDTAGILKRIAGVAESSSAVDGAGRAARFSMISSIRVLPDNRLLVVDQGAHAIRMVSDGGDVTTVVGRLNQPGLIAGALPASLDNPVSVFPIGKDIYIATKTARNLLLAKSALQ